MQIFLSFLPWIIYFTLVGFQFLEIAPLAAVIATLILSFQALRKKFLLDWCTLIYFLMLSILYLLPLTKQIYAYIPQISNFILPLIMWFSIIIKQPFTLQYARERVGKDYPLTPRFLFVNYSIAYVWAVGLTLMAVISFLQFKKILTSNSIVIIGSILCVLIPYAFMIYFPKVVYTS